MGEDGVDIARTLRERRRALGLTRARLADQAGLDAADVTRWERGDGVPGPEDVIVLADALDLDISVTQAWLDAAPDAVADSDTSESTTAPADPFSTDPGSGGSDTGLLGRIADRLARRDDRAEPASVTSIAKRPRRPAPSASTGLVSEPRPAARLPSVFPEPALTPYDPEVHVYSAGPVRAQTDAEAQTYLLRRVRTAAVLIVLGIVLWWASGSLWEGLGDVIDLFRAPTSGVR